jgi:hypothetical protein
VRTRGYAPHALLVEDTPGVLSFGKELRMTTVQVLHDLSAGAESTADFVLDPRTGAATL